MGEITINVVIQSARAAEVAVEMATPPATFGGRGGAQIMHLNDSSIAMRVVIHREALSNKRPLVIVNSVDFPMPPSLSVREKLWMAGYQTIFIERPGFGSSRPLPDALLSDYLIKSGATVSAEAALLHTLLEQMQLKRIVLLGMGSGNPVCYRLAKMNANIDLSIFSNPMFNQNIWSVFRPSWFQRMLRETVVSRAGLKFAACGVKFQMRRAPLNFYRQILSKSPGDLRYLEANPDAFVSASRLFSNIEVDTFNYDLNMSLAEDEQLHDTFFAGLNAIIMTGEETTDVWKRELEAEATRLSLPVTYLPSGDLYAPYASPEGLIKTLRTHARSELVSV